MKKILISFMILVIVLAGCSSNGSKKTVCTSSQDGMKNTTTLFSNGDGLTKIVQKQEITYESVQMTKEEVKAALEASQSKEKQEGITISNNFGNKSVSVTTTLDFTKISKDLVAQTQFTLNENGSVNFDDAIAVFEAQGLTCKK